MKKSLVWALVTCFMLVTGTAFAAEIPNPFDVKFDGSVTVQYRNDKVTPVGGEAINNNGFKILGFLNANKKLADNVDFYARFSYETFTGTTIGQDYISKEYNGAIDSFGLKITSGDWKWTVGSQGLTIGQGLVYDNGFIGKHALPYAIDAKGKMGVVDTNVFWAKTNYQGDAQNDTFYGVQLGYDVSPKANIGAFYTKWNPGDAANSSANFYGINTVMKIDDKLTFNAEYAKSSADTDNKAYIAGLAYQIDKKNKIGFSTYRSEDLSNIPDGNFGGMTTAPNANTKGYIFSYGHKLGSDTTLSVTYDSYKHINDTAVTGAANDRDRTRVGVTFVF